MYTVIETPVYSSKVGGIFTDDERDAFAVYIASNPNVGTVVRGSGGIRKVRWGNRDEEKAVAQGLFISTAWRAVKFGH